MTKIYYVVCLLSKQYLYKTGTIWNEKLNDDLHFCNSEHFNFWFLVKKKKFTKHAFGFKNNWLTEY